MIVNELYCYDDQYGQPYILYYYSSGPVSVTLYHAHCWVVEFHPRTAAIRSLDYVPLYVSFATSFTPSVIPTCHNLGGHYSAPLHSNPLNPIAPLDSSSLPGSASTSKSESEYKTVAAYAALLFASSKLMPACSHHRQDTLTPSLRMDRLQSSRIGRVAIYCAAVFCL